MVYKYQLEKFNSMKMPVIVSNSHHGFYVCQPELGFPVDNAKYFQTTFRHSASNFPLSSNNFSQTKETQADKISELL